MMEIRNYFNLIKRWIWLLVLVSLLGVAAGWILSRYQARVYRASTTILIMQAAQNQLPDIYYVNDKQQAQTFAQLIVTQPVIQTTSERLGYPVDMKQITVKQVPDAELIQVIIEDNDPQRAADIANTLVAVFLEQNTAVQNSRFASAEESLQTQIQQVEGQISDLQNKYVQQNEDSYKQQVDEVSKTIANLQNEISQLQSDIVQLDYVINPPVTRFGRNPYAPTPSVDQQLDLVKKQDRMSELKSLLAMYQKIYVDLSFSTNNQNNSSRNTAQIQAAITQYQQIYSNLLTNYEAIRLASMRSTPNIVQVEKAQASKVPVRPQPLMNMTVGGILGLIVAGAFAFTNEYLDDTLRSPDEVSEILHLPVLGYIGDMNHHRLPDTKRRDLPYVLAQPRSPVTEAFRSLRANLEFVDIDQPVKTLVVTSSTLSEGKTTIATNLAIVMSQLGRKVILIDADLRRPRVHKALNISNVMGLSDVLRKHATVQEVGQAWGNSNLIVITSGSLPPNPAEVLSSDRMTQVLNELKDIADMIIIDSPPSILADASVLAARADGVLLVIQSNKTQMNAAMGMIEQFKLVGARVIGVALNRINTRESYYYYGDLKNYNSYAYDIEKTQPGTAKKK
jgi:polysaccharide biosynthesis transport protein